MLGTNILAMSTPPTVSPAPARSGKVERTRARILTAAIDLFTRAGYEKTTVAQIAATMSGSYGSSTSS